jgi:DNA-binding beta-propeller fold protein YncE
MALLRRILPPLLIIACLPAFAVQLKQVAILDLPGRPGFDGMAVVNGHLVMAHSAADTVDIFSTAKRRIVAQVKGLKRPRGLAVDHQQGQLFIANSGGNSITVISTADWQVKSTIPLQFSPQRLLFVPELNRLMVSNWLDHSVSSVALPDGSIQTTDVGGRPEYMVFDPVRRVVFVTVQDRSEIVALDSEMKVADRYAVAASQPTGVAMDVNARRMFVAVRYAVLVLDADRGTELGRIPAAAGTDTLWFDESARTLYAAATGGTISVIRQEGSRYVQQHEYNTGVRGHTLAYDSGNKMLYLPGGREGRSKLLILKNSSQLLPAEPAAEAQVARQR